MMEKRNVRINPLSANEPVIATVPSTMSDEEVFAYCDLITSGGLRPDDKGGEIVELDIDYADGDNVALDYKVQPVDFVRIRRITGYLVGSLDRFGNAKRAEEHDRVKHISATGCCGDSSEESFIEASSRVA